MSTFETKQQNPIVSGADVAKTAADKENSRYVRTKLVCGISLKHAIGVFNKSMY